MIIMVVFHVVRQLLKGVEPDTTKQTLHHSPSPSVSLLNRFPTSRCTSRSSESTILSLIVFLDFSRVNYLVRASHDFCSCWVMQTFDILVPTTQPHPAILASSLGMGNLVLRQPITRLILTLSGWQFLFSHHNIPYALQRYKFIGCCLACKITLPFLEKEYSSPAKPSFRSGFRPKAALTRQALAITCYWVTRLIPQLRWGQAVSHSPSNVGYQFPAYRRRRAYTPSHGTGSILSLPCERHPLSCGITTGFLLVAGTDSHIAPSMCFGHGSTRLAGTH